MLKKISPLTVSLAIKDLLASKLFVFSFVFNLSLGLVGFIFVQTLSASLTTYLDLGAKKMLGGDFIISGARPITSEEELSLKNLLPPSSRMRKEVSMLTMSALKSKTRLVEVKAVDNLYPFYGVLKLDRLGDFLFEAHNFDAGREALLAPELKVQLDAKGGDEVKVGEGRFTVKDFIAFDPTVSQFGIQLAPRIYIPLSSLKETGLIGRGSRVSYATLLELPQGYELAKYESAIRELFVGKSGQSPSLSLRVKTSRESANDMGRVLSYLSDYLGLVALVATFLTGIGGTYLFRHYLSKKSRDIAIFLSLGLTLRRIIAIFIIEIIFLALLAGVLGTGISYCGLPLFRSFFGSLIPHDLIITVNESVFIEVMALAAFGSLMFALPVLSGIKTTNPQTLLREGEDAPLSQGLSGQFMYWLPSLLFYWGMAVYQSSSWNMGSIFVAGFIAAFFLLWVLGRGLLGIGSVLLKKWISPGAWPFVVAGLSLTRRRAPTMLGFLGLALGAMLMCLVPMLKSIIASDLESGGTLAPPSLFLFDILDEETDQLKRMVADHQGELRHLSPLIRAQLISVNQITAKDWLKKSVVNTREAEEAERSLLRGYNLSYREKLAESESLVSGREFAKEVGEVPEISLEYRFAERLGLTLGDQLTFLVEGVSITGRVVSTRKVQWTSFAPNFFVQFQPGVLNDAPKTFVATIFGLSPQGRQSLQAGIVEKFPHISVVDVHEATGRILALVDQISQALLIMSILAQLASLAVVVAITTFQADERAYEMQVLKVLGGRIRPLFSSIIFEFLLLGILAGILGAGLAVIFAYVLAYVAFEKIWVFKVDVPLQVALMTSVSVVLVGALLGGISLLKEPLGLLNKGRTN